MSPRVIDAHTTAPGGHVGLACPCCGAVTLFGPDDFPLDVRDEVIWWRRICCPEVTANGGDDGMASEPLWPDSAGMDSVLRSISIRDYLRKIGAIR